MFFFSSRTSTEFTLCARSSATAVTSPPRIFQITLPREPFNHHAVQSAGLGSILSSITLVLATNIYLTPLRSVFFFDNTYNYDYSSQTLIPLVRGH